MGRMLPSAVLTHFYNHDEDCGDDHHCHLIASSSEDSRVTAVSTSILIILLLIWKYVCPEFPEYSRAYEMLRQVPINPLTLYPL